jgi:hypothetical protein
MEANGYLAVNSEKAIFMKREGRHFIIHGLFMDDTMHITNNKFNNEFIVKYSRDLNITGGGFMKTFLGMEIEQSNRSIKLNLGHYVREMLNEYKGYIKKSLRPKSVPLESFFDKRIGWVARLSRAHPNRSFTGICCQASVCGFVDSLRYLFCSIAAVLRQAFYAVCKVAISTAAPMMR